MSAKYPILLALAMLFTFSACKKENDEQRKLSLRTKKNRLTGDWHLVSGNASITARNYKENYQFDGTNGTWNVLYKLKYSLSLKINKDGTFSFKDYISDLSSSSTLEARGTWNFNTGVGELKRKEEIVFFIEDVQQGYTHGANIFNRNCTNFVYKIEQLSNKKMKISSSGKILTTDNGNSLSISTNYIMEQ